MSALVVTGLIVGAGCGEPEGPAPGQSMGASSVATTCSRDTEWACKDGVARERCAAGSASKDPCERGCFGTPAGSASCAFPSPNWSCASSAHQGEQHWTCVADKLQKCDDLGGIEIRCERGCHVNPVGTDDTCNVPAATSPTQSSGGAFGYPVGDGATAPAGGWGVVQVLGHYLNSGVFVGGHLGEDIGQGSEQATAGAPVFAVADGKVLYAGSNDSTYTNVVLIEHQLGGGEIICSFYAHLDAPIVKTGTQVSRHQTIATVLDWAKTFGEANSHLHYVLLTNKLCRAAAAAKGRGVCGYDRTQGPNGYDDLASEPATYASVGDICGTQAYGNAFIAPSQFIASHHY